MTATVHQFPKRPVVEPDLTYAQLANALQVSERFLRRLVNEEGLPHGWDWSGRKKTFKLSESQAWLKEFNRQRGRDSA